MSMETQYNHKQFAILYVDDEEMSLSLFQQAFADEFRIFTAANAKDGLKLLEKHADEIGVLMTDQQMPGEKGVWLLERARQFRPRILRILVTAYSDMNAAIQAVNTGAIYKYVNKPWILEQLELTLKHALEFFAVQSERDQLLKEKRALMRERMLASRVVSLGLVAAGLNHHIGNRLLTVKTLLDLMESGAPDGDLLKKSRLDVEEILSLLSDLRVASADQTAGSLADEVRLRPVLAELLAELQPAFASRKLAVENQVPENLPALRTDKPRFKRLLELLFKYELALLPTGSRLTLEAVEATVNDKPGLVFTITDNGPTPPQDALRLVMDPLVLRGNPSEYSINLMVCFFIVRQHGGTIEAGGKTGGGNQFIIRLPLQPELTSVSDDEARFLQRVLLNEQLWDKLITQT
jgi:two-component system, probable response regulator PhcQ